MSPSRTPMQVETTMTRQTWVMLGALSLLWGCSFPFIKVAVGGAPPLTVVLLRVTIGALALAPVLVLAREKIPRGGAVWTAFFGMALLNNVVPWSLSVWGQQSLTTAVAAIINATTPLFSVIVGHFFLADERMRANRLAGVLVGFVGVAVLIGPTALTQGSDKLLPELAFIAAAISYAFSGIVGRKFARFGLTPLQAAQGQLTASALMMAPLALAFDHPWTLPMPTGPQVFSILGLGLLSTALAFILFFRILARAGATNVMLVTLLVPVTAFIIGAIFLGERLEARNFVGMAFIAAGLGLIDGRPLTYARARLFGQP